jgi:Cu(I)/Ag(I) efflux system membrane fusion protein/cobalt-zinc-cadmium efflux system membrane fusion protein
MIRFGKTTAIIFVCGLAFAGISGVFISCQKPRNETRSAPQKQIYHCPMHPNYFSDKPGNCPICGMKLVPVNVEQPQSSAISGGDRKILYYRDAMNPAHTSPRPGKTPDGMDLAPVYEDEAASEGGAVKIDPLTVQNIGVKTETVEMRSLKKDIRVSANIDLNETTVSIVNTKIMGWVEKLLVDFTGQPVKKGQPLLSLYSPDLVSTQDEYLQALRYRKGLPETASPDARKGADDLVASSKRRLMNWDIPESEIKALEDRGTPQKAMVIYSPSSGVVLEKMVVAGQNVAAGTALYKIADLSTVWAIANVFQEDLPYVKIGMETSVDLPSLPNRTFAGRVQFIAPVLDPTTKTAAVRIAIRNTPDFVLKPQMFANVEVVSPVAKSALSVSQQSVLHTGTRDIIIISLGNGLFRPQEVKVGMAAGGFVQVLSGLVEGQTIVTSAQFLLDSESNLKVAIGQMSGGN